MYSPAVNEKQLPQPRGRRAGHNLVLALLTALRPPPGPGRDDQISNLVGGQHRAAVVGAGTKAPDIFCSVFSLTFGLGEEGPVLQPGATVRLHICRAFLLTQSVPGSVPLLRKEVLRTYRRVSLCRRTPDRQAQERCCGWDTCL